MTEVDYIGQFLTLYIDTEDGRNEIVSILTSEDNDRASDCATGSDVIRRLQHLNVLVHYEIKLSNIFLAWLDKQTSIYPYEKMAYTVRFERRIRRFE